MRSLLTFSFLLFFIPYLEAQGSWSSLPDHPAGKHRNAASFQIGESVYYLIAQDQSGCSYELWKFSPSSQSWSQLNDFPGNLTDKDLDAFAIDSVGYVGTGRNCSGNTLTEFWAYYPSTDSWSQKADYPTTGGREMTIAFSVNGRGYIGLGREYDGAPKNDFYAYDPGSDSWTQIASFPGSGVVNASGLSEKGKGYVFGGGDGNGNSSKELWEYDPTNDQWNQLSDFPGQPRNNAMGFAISDHLYVGGGWDGNNLFSDYYRYDIESDTWTSIPNKPGVDTRSAEAFAVDGAGYLVGGQNPSFDLKDEVYVYNSAFVSQKEFEERESEFSVYPNPAQEKVRVEMSEGESDSRDLHILSSEGRTVLTERMNGGHKNLEIDDLADGLYFVEVITTDGTIDRKKLILE